MSDNFLRRIIRFVLGDKFYNDEDGTNSLSIADCSTELQEVPGLEPEKATATVSAQKSKPAAKPKPTSQAMPKKVDITSFKQGSLQTFTNLLCDGYFIDGSISMDELSVFLTEKSKEHPGCILLSTLDDYNQAFYTSGHSIDKHDLDDVKGYDLSSVDTSAFENGEHTGHLSTKSEFFIRKDNFFKKTGKVQFHDLRNVLGTQDWYGGKDSDGGEYNFFSVNSEPSIILDTILIVQIVPVDYAHEAICAFPNGYFSCDHTPFENFALSQYLADNYNYRLFGIGASYLAFVREDNLPEVLAALLAKELAGYYEEPNNNKMTNRIFTAIVGKKILVIRYSD